MFQEFKNSNLSLLYSSKNGNNPEKNFKNSPPSPSISKESSSSSVTLSANEIKNKNRLLTLSTQCDLEILDDEIASATGADERSQDKKSVVKRQSRAESNIPSFEADSSDEESSGVSSESSGDESAVTEYIQKQFSTDGVAKKRPAKIVKNINDEQVNSKMISLLNGSSPQSDVLFSNDMKEAAHENGAVKSVPVHNFLKDKRKVEEVNASLQVKTEQSKNWWKRGKIKAPFV